VRIKVDALMSASSSGREVCPPLASPPFIKTQPAATSHMPAPGTERVPRLTNSIEGPRRPASSRSAAGERQMFAVQTRSTRAPMGRS
jgi:hypothetical protein